MDRARKKKRIITNEILLIILCQANHKYLLVTEETLVIIFKQSKDPITSEPKLEILCSSSMWSFLFVTHEIEEVSCLLRLLSAAHRNLLYIRLDVYIRIWGGMTSLRGSSHFLLPFY